MQCSNCGEINPEGAGFCGSCGAQMASAANATAPPPPAAPPASQPPLATPPPPPPPPTAAGWVPAPPSTGFAQAPPPPGYTPQGPGYGPQGPGPAAPPPRSGGNTGLIIALAVVGVVVLGALAGGAFLLLRGGDTSESTTTFAQIETTTTVTTVTTATTASTTPPTTAKLAGYATAEEAVEAELPEGWVYKLADDQGAQMEFWSGPPASEFTTAYLVEPASDGSWVIADTFALGATDVAMTEEEEAQWVVEAFLIAVMEDRADDAHSLTVEPFYSDPASASYSNGDFKKYTVEGVEKASDGTYWVKVEETWTYGRDRWRYHVVPTEAGWMINDLRDW